MTPRAAHDSAAAGRRYIIYGAGAIGGTVGGHLALRGHEVVLVARAAHVHALRAAGLRFVTPDGEHTLRLPATSNPAELAWTEHDVVFLCVKGQDTVGALRDLTAVAGDVPVFCFQNGVRNETIAAGYVRRVYGVMVHVGGVYLRPGEVVCRRDPPGSLVLGAYPDGMDDLVNEVGAGLSSAGFRVLVTPDVMPYKWGKLVGNLANAIGAATDGKDPGGRIAKAVRAEALALVAEAGIRAVSWEEAQAQHPELATPDRGEVAIKAHSSTWQSLMRGTGSIETDFLNGEIVRLAARLGKQAPLNAALLSVAEEMAARGDRPGAYTPDQLAARLGISA